MSKSEYNALPSDKAQAIVEKIKDDMASQGGTWRDYVGYHNKFKNYTNLTDGEDYVAYAFGADITGVPTTAAMTYEFTAKTLKKVACSFAVGFQDVRATTFAANITPTADVTWAAYTLPYEYLEKYNGSAENMTEVVIDTFNEGVANWWKDKDMVHNGAQLLSSYQLQAAASLESSTKQIVCVFGVDENGYRITDVSEAAVTTTESGLPSDMTIGINVNMNAGVAEIEFEPSKMEAYFYDLLAYSEYEKYETDEAFFAEVMYKYSSMMQYKMTMCKAKVTTESLHKGIIHRLKILFAGRPGYDFPAGLFGICREFHYLRALKKISLKDIRWNDILIGLTAVSLSNREEASPPLRWLIIHPRWNMRRG